MFDTDEHPNLEQAVQEARDSGINIAVSNLCFELWLILHQEQWTAPMHRYEIQRRSRQIGLTDGKSICGGKAEDQLMAAIPTAIKRAQDLDARHETNGSPPRSNPSSGVWRLATSFGERLISAG